MTDKTLQHNVIWVVQTFACLPVRAFDLSSIKTCGSGTKVESHNKQIKK